MSPFDSTAFWTALVAGVMAIGGFLAQRLPKRNRQAEADTTLGHGWSEFAGALREEAKEERELRYATEAEAEECKKRLSALERKCDRFESHLRSLGIPPPEE